MAPEGMVTTSASAGMRCRIPLAGVAPAAAMSACEAAPDGVAVASAVPGGVPSAANAGPSLVAVDPGSA